MLTEAAIKSVVRLAANSQKSQTILKDHAPRGEGRLALIIRALVKRVTAEWYVIYHRNGRKLVKIGAYPDLSLADARALFRDEYAPTIRAGGDPSSRFARAARSKNGGAITVEGLFTAYVEHLKKLERGSWYEVERMLLKRDDCAAGALGRDRLAKDVQPADIASALAAVYDRGSKASALQMRSYISAAWNFGIKSANDYTQKSEFANWGITVNPAAAVPVDASARRVGERVLSPEELRAFWLWLCGRSPTAQSALILRLQIICGQRVKEMCRLRDDERFRDESIYEWKTTKTRVPHAIPLPDMANEILDRLKPYPNGQYFKGKNRKKQNDKPPSDNAINQMCGRYAKETGAAIFTPRDLRRTWKTLAGKAGLSKEIRDRLQNHVSGDVSSKHYDRYDYMNEKRAAMDQWCVYLKAIIEGAPIYQNAPAKAAA